MKISYTTPIQQSDLPDLDRQLDIIKYTFQKRKRLGFFLLHPALISLSCGILALIFKLAQGSGWINLNDMGEASELISFLINHTVIFFLAAVIYPILFRILFFPLFKVNELRAAGNIEASDGRELTFEYIYDKVEKLSKKIPEKYDLVSHIIRKNYDLLCASIFYTLVIIAITAFCFIPTMGTMFAVFASIFFILGCAVLGVFNAAFRQLYLYKIKWEDVQEFQMAVSESERKRLGNELYLKAIACNPIDEESLKRAARLNNPNANFLVGIRILSEATGLTTADAQTAYNKAKPYFKKACNEGLPDGRIMYAVTQLRTESHSYGEWEAILYRVQEINKDTLSEACAKQYDDVVRDLTDIKTRIGQQEARAAMESARWISQKKLEGWTYIPDGHGGYKFGPPTSTSTSSADDDAFMINEHIKHMNEASGGTFYNDL